MINVRNGTAVHTAEAAPRQIDRLAIERDNSGTHRQNGHEHAGDGEKEPIIRGAWRMGIRPILVMRRDAHNAPGTCP